MNMDGFEAITLEKTAPLPLADQLAGELLRRITAGTLRSGDKLPPERDLAEHLGVARGTVGRAYKRLLDMGAAQMRQGSGTYVSENSNLLEENQRKEAAELLNQTFAKLKDLGLSDKEITSLVRLQVPLVAQAKKVSIMVLSNNHEMLSELEAQLTYLSKGLDVHVQLSFTTLKMCTVANNPERFLAPFDLIIASTIDYTAVLELVPMYRSKIVDAKITPRTQTIMELSKIPRTTSVWVVHRTRYFLEMVEHTLLSLGFPKEHIIAWQEDDVRPEQYASVGAGAIIGFNEAPMFIKPAYKTKNDRFIASGGHLLRFHYRIDRSALNDIEARLSQLLNH